MINIPRQANSVAEPHGNQKPRRGQRGLGLLWEWCTYELNPPIQLSDKKIKILLMPRR